MNDSSFIILWNNPKIWEYVEGHEYGPHGYAWTHDLYGKSTYSIIECEVLPETHLQTPEDILLDKIFI